MEHNLRKSFLIQQSQLIIVADYNSKFSYTLKLTCQPPSRVTILKGKAAFSKICTAEEEWLFNTITSST